MPGLSKYDKMGSLSSVYLSCLLFVLVFTFGSKSCETYENRVKDVIQTMHEVTGLQAIKHSMPVVMHVWALQL